MSHISFNHISILTNNNPTKLAQFYTDIFDCKLINSEIKTQQNVVTKQGILNNYRNVVKLQMPQQLNQQNVPYLEIVQYQNQQIQQNEIQQSLCFQVQFNQFKQIQERIQKYGGQRIGQEQKEQFYGLGIMHTIFMKDIEKNIIEIQALQKEQQQSVQQNQQQLNTQSAIDDFGYTSKSGVNGLNQDSYLSKEKFNNLPNESLFGVYDGHGPSGHFVSQYVKEWLPSNIKEFLDRNNKDDIDIRQALVQGYTKTNDMVYNKSNIDIQLSGSTGLTVYMKNNDLFCANVGDSRGILCKQSAGGFRVQALSIDHKPETHNELKRITDKGGRVEPSKNDPDGPRRVYFKDLEAPGLMMSRSFGDFLGAQVGVICTPDILKFQLNPLDRFIVLGSDGLWDFITPQKVSEVVDEVYKNRLRDKYSNAQKAADNLLKLAELKWKENTVNMQDDITVIVIFLKVQAQEQNYANDNDIYYY